MWSVLSVNFSVLGLCCFQCESIAIMLASSGNKPKSLMKLYSKFLIRNVSEQSGICLFHKTGQTLSDIQVLRPCLASSHIEDKIDFQIFSLHLFSEWMKFLPRPVHLREKHFIVNWHTLPHLAPSSQPSPVSCNNGSISSYLTKVQVS